MRAEGSFFNGVFMLVNECIEHRQNTKHGYAGVTRQGVHIRLHRLVYCENRGISLSDIEGMSVRHICDNPKCINPEHLVVGTHTDNMKDKVERGRCFEPKGEEHPGSKLTDRDVKWIRENYVKGSMTHGVNALSVMFGVARGTIRFVVQGKTWGHL